MSRAVLEYLTLVGGDFFHFLCLTFCLFVCLFAYFLSVVGLLFLFCFKVSSDLKNIDTGVNPKTKSHVTIRRAVLEEIGNKVTTRATQVAKVTGAR